MSRTYTPNNLTWEAYIKLQRRTNIGEQCLHAAGEEETDRETAAADAISHILTALYGPSGYYTPTEVTTEPGIMDDARDLLDRALRSFEHDNEDYIVEDVA